MLVSAALNDMLGTVRAHFQMEQGYELKITMYHLGYARKSQSTEEERHGTGIPHLSVIKAPIRSQTLSQGMQYGKSTDVP